VLSAVLSDTQLADARRAVVQQNVAAIKAYGKEAMKGLAALPDRNPQAFEAFIDTHYPGLQTKRDNNGRMLVLLDGDDNWTSWGAAVHMGEVRVR
jgi:hypothetical protein